MKRESLCIGMFLSVLLCPRLSVAQAESSSNPLERFSESLAKLTSQVAPAVVEILNAGYVPNKDDDDDDGSYVRQQVIGSGVVVSSDGYIVTNSHVIKGAKHIHVVFVSTDSSSPSAVLRDEAARFDAKLVGAHEDTDLAVLKIDAENLPTIPLAEYSKLRQGQIVIAVGSPLGMKNSVSIGVISAVARQPDDDKPIAYIQTDAAINPGNSGGALVDAEGRLVGITSAQSINGERLGFAIPSDVVKSVYEEIRKNGFVHRGDIGVEVQNITPLIAKGLGLSRLSGVVVTGVKGESAAEKAGLRPADVVLRVDAKNVGSIPEFQSTLYFKTNGDIVNVEVLRRKEKITFRIPVVDHDPTSADAMLGSNVEKSLVRRLGVFVADLDEDALERTPGLREPNGVLVRGKASDLQIVGCDLKAGDVIHSFNGKKIADVDSLRRDVETLTARDAVVLLIERKQKYMFLAFEAE